MFITFEGGEGCGKTTQLTLLGDWLEKRCHRVVRTREPGGTALGRSLRGLLLDARSEITPTAELLLYATDRAEHLARVVRPALASGAAVLCDRFSDSTVAYQGYGRGLDLGLIERLNAIATGGLLPDLTFWLKLDPQAGLVRRLASNGNTPDRIEAETLAFHQRVHMGFAALANRYPGRIRPVDAGLSVEATAEQIRSAVDVFLNENQSKLEK
ncbi:dTMP kinase [Gloeobacter violaceus]|uniref:Thymidylate kinase n=1 Tax=Gloeobacter violaceus (strain ATCC 29082 / PCC 7421) TaxID=251221 RepID=KTHY_GLOVI|nr:dTMP kinase [Gloeobacter violaceus]Q7NMT7.1 RecName: Full=Thymidylate kinase; AltName: Full=dTMP kinase [Gloeobacter violaceus PCC 7421]BAC88619.1 thymidylate kinase [Gloeobacter violaceus PCC 7421]